VGEYVGNQDYQHLVSYSRQTILFYALVDNSAPAICLPPAECHALTRRFGLDHVTMHPEGTFDSYDGLCDRLEELYRVVAESSISSEEEGSVLYFLNANTGEVLSMCKLKTLEYRVLRKLREKMRNLIAAHKEGESPQKALERMRRFTSESVELCEGFTLPHDLSVYQQIADLGFRCIFDPKRGLYFQELLETRYIDFLKEVMRSEGLFDEGYIQEFFGSKVFEDKGGDQLLPPTRKIQAKEEEVKVPMNGRKVTQSTSPDSLTMRKVISSEGNQ
jgi:hypothetical protein